MFQSGNRMNEQRENKTIKRSINLTKAMEKEDDREEQNLQLKAVEESFVKEEELFCVVSLIAFFCLGCNETMKRDENIVDSNSMNPFTR
jgi:hypothetical protein